MFVLARTVTYASLFIGLVFLPSRLLSSSGVTRPAAMGAAQMAGMLVAAIGAIVALWCVFAFALIGKGTPAPFDPPRRLVVYGPYRFVRNPMYLGAVTALLGAALFYESPILAAYAGVFLLVCHVFVLAYEEPTLTRLFGSDYDAYRGRVHRWLPGAQRG